MTKDASTLYGDLDLTPPEHLARNQRDPDRATKVVTAAHERRIARKKRRQQWAERAGLAPSVFKIDLRAAHAEDGTS